MVALLLIDVYNCFVKLVIIKKKGMVNIMENNDYEDNEELFDVDEKINTMKNNKKKIIIIVIAVVLVLAGIIGGVYFANNKDKITNIINNENKVAKKIDESKPWVYDADYKNENKKIYADSKKTEEYASNSSKDLVAPYINIDSDYAKEVNEKIKKLYDDYYSKYGTEVKIQYSNQYKAYYVYSLSYEYHEKDNILSVIVKLHEGQVVVDGGTGGGVLTVYTYNFNLDTLSEASLEEMAKKCGFSSETEVKNKISEWEEKQKSILEKSDFAEIFNGVQKNKYCIDGDGKLNFVYRISTSGTMDTLQAVEKDKDIELFYTEDNEKDHNQIYSKNVYFEHNKNLEYSSNPKDSINGKVAIIKMGEEEFQTKKQDGYYTYTDNFGNSYNIKEIINITSEYVTTGNDGWANLFKAVIEYIDNNNKKKSFDTAVIIPKKVEEAYIYGPYENYTGTTAFVRGFTQLYVYETTGKYSYEKEYNSKKYSITNKYTVLIGSENDTVDLSDIEVETTVKQQDKTVTNTIEIDDFDLVKTDAAAGTKYTEFKFKGKDSYNNKCTGTVKIGVNKNSDDGKGVYSAEITFDKNTYMEGIDSSIVQSSTKGFISLEIKN